MIDAGSGTGSGTGVVVDGKTIAWLVEPYVSPTAVMLKDVRVISENGTTPPAIAAGAPLTLHDPARKPVGVHEMSPFV
jgi:hypothetical protein